VRGIPKAQESYWHDGVPEEIAGAGGLWEDSAAPYFRPTKSP